MSNTFDHEVRGDEDDEFSKLSDDDLRSYSLEDESVSLQENSCSFPGQLRSKSSFATRNQRSGRSSATSRGGGSRVRYQHQDSENPNPPNIPPTSGRQHKEQFSKSSSILKSSSSNANHSKNSSKNTTSTAASSSAPPDELRAIFSAASEERRRTALLLREKEAEVNTLRRSEMDLKEALERERQRSTLLAERCNQLTSQLLHQRGSLTDAEHKRDSLDSALRDVKQNYGAKIDVLKQAVSDAARRLETERKQRRQLGSALRSLQRDLYVEKMKRQLVDTG
ncbi:unnamed protein product [Amoebophrya sp. A25]|nr:unnamed protein product [Amoebophrya sp. A25]|eukprot:GSA25T00024491001.1